MRVQGFVYSDALRIAAELDAAGDIVSRFVYGDGVNVPDAMIKGGVTYRILKDHLGSPRLVVDATTGDVAQVLEYDAFGVVLNDTNRGFQPFGFAGGLYDHETGLVRFGARDYDASVGRWTAKDPILFDGGQANLYVYVDNNPVTYVDPRGELLAGVAVGVGWALVTAAGYIYIDVYLGPGWDAEDTGLPGQTDGPQDAYRHCLASCVATSHFGEGFAKFLGDLNESGDQTRGSCMDRFNNEKGRDLGRRQDAGINYCRDACRSALDKHVLQTKP